MQEIFRTIEKVAPTDAPVVISGESGTGKELVADALHGMSRRRPALREDQLRGDSRDAAGERALRLRGGGVHRRDRQHRGKFEQADGGSLFLDEIGDLSLDTQAKLLRVLQDRELTRLGGTRTVMADARIIAATNKDIAQMIRQGKFREDLFYRMSVIAIVMPPLRERAEDIGVLSDHFLRQFAAMYAKRIAAISSGVRRLLLAHDWPGNVRELKNCMERAVIFCEGIQLTEEDLPASTPASMIESALPGGHLRRRSPARD